MKVIVEADGGSRGNPGPAGFGSVVWSEDHSTVLAEVNGAIGTATNNVAEYRALLLGAACAHELGATEVDIVGDSELIAKQVKGVYKVKHAGLRELHAEALAALRAFDRWSIRTVPREQNAEADALVNDALDRAGADGEG